MIKVAIVTHEARARWCIDLIRDLLMQGIPANDIKVLHDDGSFGAKANHLRAIEWLAEFSDQDGYGIVLEDDVTLCEDFMTNLGRMMYWKPYPVASLYLGRGRPAQFQERIAVAIAQVASFITADALFSAQGYLMPLAFFAQAHSDMSGIQWEYVPIDEHLTSWLRSMSYRVAYPKYSLIDHRDGPTLIEDHGDGQPRNGTTALCVDGCDPSGATLPEIRKPWLMAGHNTAWNLGSTSLPEGVHAA